MVLTPILAFDIETIPDCAGIRRLYDLPEDLPDAEVAEVAFQKRRAQAGSDFLPPHLQRVVVISCVLRDDEGVKIFSIGEPERDEKAAIQRFFDGIDKYDAAARLLERRRLRPAGAQPPRADPRRRCCRASGRWATRTRTSATTTTSTATRRATST